MLNLVLLYGGKSGEHEISLISAASVLANLDSTQYNIIPIGLDKDGRCYLNDYHTLLEHKDALPVVTSNSRLLPSLLLNGQLAVEADIVFPVVHGPLYEDGCLQGLLELADVAYVGCGVLSSAIGMDKDIARRLIKVDGIQTARTLSFSGRSSPTQVESICQKAVAEFGWPLFVKPCSMGSSVGIHKATTMAELANAVADARRYDETILIEEYLEGREIEVAVLENMSATSLPNVSLPGEIRVNHADGFYSYTAKYLESGEIELIIPAKLDEHLVSRLQQAAAEIFRDLKCKGMARVDFFVNDQTGHIYFNEINTIPGFTPISMYPMMWKESGLSYPELLNCLIKLAITHHQCRKQLVRHYQ